MSFSEKWDIQTFSFTFNHLTFIQSDLQMRQTKEAIASAKGRVHQKLDS